MDDDDQQRDGPAEHASDPAERAHEKAAGLRMHAELFAVFEGCRKFDAVLRTRFDAGVARDLQQSMGRLANAKEPESPILPPAAIANAAALLTFHQTHELSTNDYHLSRRPGEVMIARWLEADEVETFYGRLQAHFDVALEQCREDEHQALGWKRDPATAAYLKSLDELEFRMEEYYLRSLIRTHNLSVLSMQAADAINIAYLSDYVMSVPVTDLVGTTSAPPEVPTDRDLSWYFKLFSLRGMVEGVERMCFFTYLQKSDDTFDFDE